LTERRGFLKSKQICHIEFIEMRTNLFANHCYISTMLNMTLIEAFEAASSFIWKVQLLFEQTLYSLIKPM